MKLIDKAIRIEEYLSNWYSALPVPALHILFGLEPDELYAISEEDFEDRIFELKDEWEDLELIDKIHLHDKYEDKFFDFTSGIKLNINKAL
jgi:hypothetical protein